MYLLTPRLAALAAQRVMVAWEERLVPMLPIKAAAATPGAHGAAADRSRTVVTPAMVLRVALGAPAAPAAMAVKVGKVATVAAVRAVLSSYLEQ